MFGGVDGDGLPEVVAADTSEHVVIFEHDGTVKLVADRAGFEQSEGAFQGPTVALYDLDGDGTVEILLGFDVFDHEGKPLWGVPASGEEFDEQFHCVTPTAADLDGDGKLEVLTGLGTYRYEGTLLWRVEGQPPSKPHVAAFDGDRSAERVYVSSRDNPVPLGPTGTVLRDASRRWIPARRIWNQHSYHVTNVREDTSPMFVTTARFPRRPIPVGRR